MTIWPDMEQGSEQWFRARKGRLTASQMSKVLTPTGKLSAQWEKLAIRLAGECVKPNEAPAFLGNIHTDRGHELEPIARDWFKESTGMDVRTVGFVTNDDNPVLGCSPDALIYENEVPVAGLEIKCPLIENHALYHYEGGVPDQYIQQVHGSMAVTGLREWWFLSYNEGTNPYTFKATWNEYTDKVAEALNDFVIKYAPIRAEILSRLIINEGKEAA